MACFHPDAFPRLTRRPAEADNSPAFLSKLDAVASSFTQLIVKQLNQIRDVDNLASCRRLPTG